ncbi:hypothetical protein HAX54_043909, partial [Datura stramonium]|nr:hypothetical protein [Datura stramonium]
MGIPVITTTVLRNYWAERSESHFDWWGGEDNLLFLLLFLRFGDGGPTVGNSRHKQVDRRGPALLLLHRGAVLARSKDVVNGGGILVWQEYCRPLRAIAKLLYKGEQPHSNSKSLTYILST